MDHDSFDDLSRATAESTSRRQALKLLGAAFAAGVFASGRTVEARADPPPGVGCKPAGKKCTKSRQCCSGLTCQNGHCAAICTPSGSPCDIGNPGACCSLCCTSVGAVGSPFVCC